MIGAFFCGFFTGIFVVILCVAAFVMFKSVKIYQRIQSETKNENGSGKTEQTQRSLTEKQETFAISLKQSMKSLFNI